MGFFSEINQHKYRSWKTINVCLSFMALGLIGSLPGPTMLDLQLQLDADLEEIALILPVKSAGNMVGAIICGFLILYVDHQIIIPISLFFMGITTLLVPFAASLSSLYTILMLTGISCGFLANTGNVWLIHLWGKENPPFMQILHFAYGLGSFFSPMIAEPFLAKTAMPNFKLNDNQTQINAINFDSNWQINNNQTDTNPSVNIVEPPTLNLKYAYGIVAGITFACSVCFVLTALAKRDNKPHPSRVIDNKVNNQKNIGLEVESNQVVSISSESKEIEANKKNKNIRKIHKIYIVLLGAVFMHLIYGVELSFGSLLPTFAVKSQLSLSKSTASFVTSMYWGCFTFFRCITVVLVTFFSSRTMLIFDLVLIMISNFILLPLGNTNEPALWIGASLMGLGVSSVFPSFLGYLEDILPVTSRMTSLFTVFSCIGEFIIPVMIGLYIEKNPMIYLYVIFAYGALACFVFACCCLIEHKVYKFRRNQGNNQEKPIEKY